MRTFIRRCLIILISPLFIAMGMLTFLTDDMHPLWLLADLWSSTFKPNRGR